MTSDESQQSVVVAEKKERLADLQETMYGMGGDFGRLAEHMQFLWEHPDFYESGDLVDSWKGDELLMVFEMGVVFGIDYEQAYPEGENEKWPIAPKDRGSEDAN